MGIATAPSPSINPIIHNNNHHHHNQEKYNSMSQHHQDQFHQQQQQQANIYSAFSNGLALTQQQQQQDQIRRDNKLRPTGFEPTSGTLAGFDQPTAPATTDVDPSTTGLHQVYDQTGGMLSEMFNFGHGPAGPAQDMMDYRRAVGGLGNPEWFAPPGARQVAREDNTLGDHNQHPQMPSINAEAMQLFMTNPQPRSPSPPQPQPQPQQFHHPMAVHPSNNPNFWATGGELELGGIVEGQGLSLSLSTTLQAKQAEELRDTHNIMFFNQPSSSNNNNNNNSPNTTSSSSHGQFFKNLAGGGASHHQQHHQHHHHHNASTQQPIMMQSLQPILPSQQHQVHLGFGAGVTTTASSLGVVNVLRNSKYAKPAMELLEEFCSVGRGQLKKSKLARQNSVNPSSSGGGGGGGGVGSSSISNKDQPPPQLSAADRIEHQRRKVKLLSMLDEVDRRYNHYCEQMQMVVNSFDLVMGFGAAVPYTALAQKAMSRHFRCLKDSIQVQLKQSCELLGEKDPTASSGLTRGETPRLKMLEQSLRQQRAFHQMGMMEQEAWRPQRGLPERSVNALRAWLFEHFLHPYPSDADKHMLARQTGLSRNQVSNWFINARVRLWKPMVEEMYQQEFKELQEEEEKERNQNNETQTSSSTSNTNTNTNSAATTQQQAQNPMPSSSTASVSVSVSSATTTVLTDAKRSADTMTTLAPQPDNDPSLLSINRYHQQQQQPPPPPHVPSAFLQGVDDTCHFSSGADDVGGATMIRFGNATTGDVSLTLGLRHTGNAPENNTAAFSVRDFGSC